MGARAVLVAARRRDDELIRSQHELRCDARARFRDGVLQQALTTRALGVERRFRGQHVDGVERFGRRNQRGALTALEAQPEIPRAPEHAACLVTAALLYRVQNVVDAYAFQRERRLRSGNLQSERRQVAALESDLVFVPMSAELVWC